MRRFAHRLPKISSQNRRGTADPQQRPRESGGRHYQGCVVLTLYLTQSACVPSVDWFPVPGGNAYAGRTQTWPWGLIFRAAGLEVTAYEGGGSHSTTGLVLRIQNFRQVAAEIYFHDVAFADQAGIAAGRQPERIGVNQDLAVRYLPGPGSPFALQHAIEEIGIEKAVKSHLMLNARGNNSRGLR